MTKNVCEVFGQAGYIRTTYTYSPYGAVTASGDVSQPFRRSSEFDDEELGLVYYNYRHFNPTDGRWISRDPIDEQNGGNFLEENEKHLLYIFINNSPFCGTDIIGLTAEWENGDVKDIVRQSYSIDFPAVELTQAADKLILLPIFNSKAIISAAYSAILMPGAAIQWNRHVVFMHRHFLAGSGTDYTYMPDKIKGLEYSVREGYRYGKSINFKSPIRMKSWHPENDIENEAYTLKSYSYIVGGNFDKNCDFHYTVYIKDRYDFNFIKDSKRSYLTFDNFARLMGGVISGFLANAKDFIVKGKREGVLLAKDFNS
ncbi:MAG: hypothetical protein LUE08_08175 [Akkermansiaceae bacterium]|nr:hypothetical protein [Akkermansiaceae bacterium]